jgi:hypothetical protein
MAQKHIKCNFQVALQWQTTYETVKALYSTEFRKSNVITAKVFLSLNNP